MPDQVRLHHVIFLEKVVLAAIARINDAPSTQMHRCFFEVATNFLTCPKKTMSLLTLGILYIHSSLSVITATTLHTHMEKNK